jgi:hypothetical protein
MIPNNKANLESEKLIRMITTTKESLGGSLCNSDRFPPGIARKPYANVHRVVLKDKKTGAGFEAPVPAGVS